MAKTSGRAAKDGGSRRLGEVIRELRESAGLTQHALAKAATIDQAVLARVENETRAGVQFATVCRLAAALGVSLDDLAAAAGLKGRRTASPRAGVSAKTLAEITRARLALERALRELATLD